MCYAHIRKWPKSITLLGVWKDSEWRVFTLRTSCHQDVQYYYLDGICISSWSGISWARLKPLHISARCLTISCRLDVRAWLRSRVERILYRVKRDGEIRGHGKGIIEGSCLNVRKAWESIACRLCLILTWHEAIRPGMVSVSFILEDGYGPYYIKVSIYWLFSCKLSTLSLYSCKT